jgi:hypothetical protein
MYLADHLKKVTVLQNFFTVETTKPICHKKRKGSSTKTLLNPRTHITHGIQKSLLLAAGRRAHLALTPHRNALSGSPQVRAIFRIPLPHLLSFLSPETGTILFHLWGTNPRVRPRFFPVCGCLHIDHCLSQDPAVVHSCTTIKVVFSRVSLSYGC